MKKNKIKLNHEIKKKRIWDYHLEGIKIGSIEYDDGWEGYMWNQTDTRIPIKCLKIILRKVEELESKENQEE